MKPVSDAGRAGGAPGWVCDLATEAEMRQLAADVARFAEPPLTLWLRGDLGAGKTTFARAYIHALGFEGYVKSPSYGLLETYPVDGQTVLHLDLYRIEDPEELEYLAIRDLYDEHAVLLVEWPDRGAGHLPPPDLVLEFTESGPGRQIRFAASSEAGEALSRSLVRYLRQ